MSARMTDLDLAVARRLRERRIVLGLTQQEVGDLAGVACQQVQKYEAGINRLSVGRLVTIAAALGTSAAELLADIAPAGPVAPQDHTWQREMLETARNLALLDAATRRAVAAFVRALANVDPCSRG